MRLFKLTWYRLVSDILTGRVRDAKLSGDTEAFHRSYGRLWKVNRKIEKLSRV